MSCADASPLLLGRYSRDDLRTLFAAEGVLSGIEARGFTHLDFDLDASREPLLHLHLYGSKAGARHLLMDVCLTEVRVSAASVPAMLDPGSSLDLLVVYWLREQDPTAEFDVSHIRLPLQAHPGLGVLKRAFRVALRVARDLSKHGIAALPKFFHDAVIFYRSRLFLFLDPVEQGRFEALLRDLSSLSLVDATLALAGSAVLDADGNVLRWQPGFQVMPLAPELTDWFHHERYQTACRAACERLSFTVDESLLAQAREVYEQSLGAPAGND